MTVFPTASMASRSSQVFFGLGIVALLIALVLIAKAGDQGGLWKPSGSGAVTAQQASMAPVTGLPSEETAIVNTVQKAQGAVASVIISKDLPVYHYVQQTPDAGNGNMDPFFQQFFPQMQRVQDGTQTQQIGAGSAFFISGDGLMLTNRHVVSDTSAQYTVVTNDGKELPATVVARDPGNDIALLKVDIKDVPYLSLSPSDDVHPGQTAIAIGNALGQFSNTVSVGVISGLQRSIQANDNGSTEELDSILQTDAAINEGNSGGPLLDSTGNVIGMDTAIASGGQNIGFALPVAQLRRVLESYKKNGRIVQAYLGVRYVVITPELEKQNKLSVDDGVLIERGDNQGDLAVMPGSPADKAGLLENDIITEVDGVKVGRTQSLAAIVTSHEPGDTLKLTVLRKGQQITVSVTLAELKQ